MQLFGSLPAGMALHNSDMDIVVLNLARPAVQGYPKGERPRVRSSRARTPPAAACPVPPHRRSTPGFCSSGYTPLW